MLEKDDLKAIKEIVNERAEKTETYLKDYVEFAIDKSEIKLSSKIEESEERIVGRINREITDMAENLNQIAAKIDKVDDHERRIRKLEVVAKKC